MFVIGLTGSIGMGKSTVAGWFAARGVPVFDSDAVVHALYAGDGAAVAPVEARFPGVTVDGGIDRTKLSARLADDKDGFRDLEGIIHPLVREAQVAFVASAKAAGAQVCVLDIPLLFETDAEARFDLVVVAACSEATQTARVLQRPNITREKLDAIRARQMPSERKAALADVVIDTDQSLAESEAAVDRLLQDLRGRIGTAYAASWS
ncbi:MAG: dephospho-CoA kinase [Pseudomonadota bacterium]